jgi:stalled ribosome rescue protein Dom34
MTPKKQIGIWMDHSIAHISEMKDNTFISRIVKSEFTHTEKEQSLGRSENLMHHKEQHQQSSYYKKITEVLKDYNEIVLFGPTTAKNELLNLLKADHHFENKKIEVRQTDKMTENQQHEFVRNYFHCLL